MTMLKHKPRTIAEDMALQPTNFISSPTKEPSSAIVSSLPEKLSGTSASSTLEEPSGVLAMQKDNPTLSVPTTQNTQHRTYDKRYYCLFCQKPQTKLKRHLNGEHKNEQQIIEYTLITDQTKKDQLLEKLRNMGNHIHNCDVIRNGKGQFAVKYRPSKHTPFTDYGPCPYCYGYFVRKQLWRHKCPFKPIQKSGLKPKMAVSSRLLLPPLPGANKILTSVIAGMRSDQISRIAKSDKTIMNLAGKLSLRIGEDSDQYNYIRQKLREMGRLLDQLRTEDNSPNKSMKDFIDPKFFRLFVSACKAVAHFDSSVNRYKIPSLALKLGQSVIKCCDILLSEGIEHQNTDLQKNVTEFKQLMELNWTEEVTSNALKTLREAKMNSKTSMLPLADDVKLLTKYLQDTATHNYQTLISSHDLDQIKLSWVQLSEIVLTQLILFNRRRAGEVSKMRLKDYESKHVADVEGPVAETLSGLERKLCRILQRCEIIGKTGRPVPVLFNAETIRHLDALIEKRHRFVDESNKYLFPRLGSAESHIRGTDTMRILSKQCGAQRPECLRSTKLRKHIATLTQVLNLKDNELDVLANFLGHDIKVHREYYRLPDATIQVAKVAQLLLRMEKGGVGLTGDETLESIRLDEEEIEQDLDGKLQSFIFWT